MASLFLVSQTDRKDQLIFQ